MSGNGTRPRRVALIGLDALCWPFAVEHFDVLPNLRRASEHGVMHPLRLRANALTGAMWPSTWTGQHPGQHGFYHDLGWDPAAMRMRRVAADWLHYEPFWHRFDAAGLRVVVVDAPHTFPPQPRRGAEVVNWNSHDHMSPFATHPPELAGEIVRRFGGRAIGYEIPTRLETAQLAAVRDDQVRSARKRGELCSWLLREREWDFFLTVFGESHRAGHLLWPRSFPHLAPPPPDALLDVYRAIDAALGEIVGAADAAGDVMVMLYAANGMGENTGQEHFMGPLMERVNAEFLRQEGAANGRRTPRRGGIVRLLRERLPGPLQNAIGQLTPIRLRDEIVNRSYLSGIDWSCTPAFALRGDVAGYVRFNLHGREARGWLSPGEQQQRYEAWLIACLNSLTLDDGSPAVRRVFFSRDTYPGPRQSFLPDVVVTWGDAPIASRIRSDLLGDVVCRPDTGRSGNHRPEGFCLVTSPTEDASRADAIRHISDLAPFLLHHYGIDPAATGEAVVLPGETMPAPD